MKPFIIVGSGLFGSMIAHGLRARGEEVTLVDCNRKFRGSGPAACLMKPSWMTSLDYKPPLAFLEEHVGVETITFSIKTAIGKLAKSDVFWSDPRRIMCFGDEVVDDRVVAIRPGEIDLKSGKTMKGNIIVAAGVWTADLLAEYELPTITALCGSALFSKGKVEDPTIYAYAPYRQAVWFNRGKNMRWFGDGTALIKKSFTEEAVAKTLTRGMEMAGFPEDAEVVSGMRPYAKGEKNGVFRILAKGLAVSTGGAKNGTILAANHAIQALASNKGFL